MILDTRFSIFDALFLIPDFLFLCWLMMHTVKLTIAYDGTAYKGWQVQPNGVTIQELLEKSLQKIYKQKITIYGAGRTDAGVHAKKQVAHYKTRAVIPEKKIAFAVNTYLPRDISVVKSEYVSGDFHARFSAKRKTYRYRIYNSSKFDPFKTRYAWKVLYELDIGVMEKAANELKGKHDFKSFQAKDKKKRDSMREIYDIRINKRGSMINIDVTANGFLYNMMRNIVGTLVDISRGYFPDDSMKDILISQDRAKSGTTAPPQGLFLMDVRYWE